MPHRFLSGCLLMVVSVSMMPHGEAVSAALFISTRFHGCINMPYVKQRRFMRISIQVIMLLSMAVSLMCPGQTTDRGSSSGSSSSGHKKNDRDDRKDDTKKETKKESDKETKKETKETEKHTETKKPETTAAGRRRNLKQVHLKLLRQKRRLLRPVRRIQKHLRRIRLKQVHRNRNQSRKPRRKGLVDAQSVSGI